MIKSKLAYVTWVFICTIAYIASTSANNPPTITESSPYNIFIFQGEAITFTIHATDADGDSLTWSYLQPPYTTKRGTVNHWSGGGFTYTPYTNESGSEIFYIYVSDGSSSDQIAIRNTGSEKAEDYLIKGLNPEAWTNRGVTNFPNRFLNIDERNNNLSKYALLGLSLSGTEKAREQLLLLKKQDVKNSSVFHNDIYQMLDDLLIEHQKVNELGYNEYYKKGDKH